METKQLIIVPHCFIAKEMTNSSQFIELIRITTKYNLLIIPMPCPKILLSKQTSPNINFKEFNMENLKKTYHHSLSKLFMQIKECNQEGKPVKCLLGIKQSTICNFDKTDEQNHHPTNLFIQMLIERLKDNKIETNITKIKVNY